MYIEHYVDTFLQRLRATIPVVIQEVLIGPKAEFLRADWDNIGSALDDFDAQQSGSLYLGFDVSFQLRPLFPLIVIYHSLTLFRPPHIDNIHTPSPLPPSSSGNNIRQ